MKLNIKNYAQRVQALKEAYSSKLHAPEYEALSVVDRIKMELQFKVDHIKIADEYTAITRAYVVRRYARIQREAEIPPGPTLVELLLSELPISEEYLNTLSTEIDKLSATNTYGYVVTSDHVGVCFFVLLYYGLRRNTDPLKAVVRSKSVGSFTSGLQNVYVPDVKKGKDVLTYIFAIPTTTPNIKVQRKQEFIAIQNAITKYAKYMGELRTTIKEPDEYRNLWTSAFSEVIDACEFGSVDNKSKSFALAHAHVGELAIEISRLRGMLDEIKVKE